MSKSWTPEELAAASAAMKAEGHMSYEEFCAYLERCTEKVVVVHLADGDAITTRIHGTEQDIRDYYRIGSCLNMGAAGDRLVEIVAVDIVDVSGNTTWQARRRVATPPLWRGRVDAHPNAKNAPVPP